jgi:transcriptional regulator with XRE-family HTH domain
MEDSYGATLRRRRRALDLTQAALSVAIGRSHTFICLVEHGATRATPADRERIERVLRQYETPPALPRSEPHVAAAR